METWQALILGLVEGITEYLPVSSTGHLLVAQRALGIPSDSAANAFAVAIQAGAILAVLSLYWSRFRQVSRGLVGHDPAGARLAVHLVVAFVPAAIIGFALDEKIERYLFGPWPIVAAWSAGGLLLLLLPVSVGRAGERRDLSQLDARGALIIGLFQCLALWPGTSRSLAAILGALLVGLSMRSAVEFSFLLGFVTLGAATGYKAVQQGSTMLEAYGPLPLLAGFAMAWVSAVLAVRFMVSWLEHRGLRLFGWWRLLAAGIVSTLLLVGWFGA